MIGRRRTFTNRSEHVRQQGEQLRSVAAESRVFAAGKCRPAGLGRHLCSFLVVKYFSGSFEDDAQPEFSYPLKTSLPVEFTLDPGNVFSTAALIRRVSDLLNDAVRRQFEIVSMDIDWLLRLDSAEFVLTDALFFFIEENVNPASFA